MGLIDIASNASAWRGYEYYTEGKVMSITKTGESEYDGKVSGSSKEPYSVHIYIQHPKKSTCSCPFAEGSKKVCKHKVALYFHAFPDEAKKYLDEVERAEEEEQEYKKMLYDKAEQRVFTMKKSELQEALWHVLTSSPEWVLDSFIRDYIGY